MFKRDMVYNAEWNPRNNPPERPWKLHRHPCFFGNMSDVFEDCCGFCPEPENEEARAVQKDEDGRFVRGPIEFMVDDPGRQSVGSFHPITEGDWSEMAYLSLETRVASAVVNDDVDEVKRLLETANVNKRDHTGKTMLFLAGECGSLKVARWLVENGAKLTARNFDGRTILHLACQSGNLELLELILRKSKANALEKEAKEARKAEASSSASDSDDDFEKITRADIDEIDEYTETEDDDILDINLPDWDYSFTPLHHAIFAGNLTIVQKLIAESADITIAAHLSSDYEKHVLFPILLCANTPDSIDIARLLIYEGVSSQADHNSTTALHMLVSTKRLDLVKLLVENDPKAKDVLSHLNKNTPPLLPIHTAVANKDMEMAKYLLEQGSSVQITMAQYFKHCEATRAWWFRNYASDEKKKIVQYGMGVTQPLETAIRHRNIEMVKLLVEFGAEVSAAPSQFYYGWNWKEYVFIFYAEIGLRMECRTRIFSTTVCLF
jgi:ankyrin repeat protein